MEERRETRVQLKVDLIKECEQNLKFIKKQRRRINQKQHLLDRLRSECKHEIGVHIGDVSTQKINICAFCETPIHEKDTQPLYIIEAPKELMLKEEVYDYVERVRKAYIKFIEKEPEMSLEDMVSQLKQIV